jgi:hypothetical protein
MGWWRVSGAGRMAGEMTTMTMSMNTKRLRNWLAAAAALGESLAILDLKGVMPLLPEGWAVWVAGVPTFAALIVHVVKAFGDSLGRLEEGAETKES